LNDVAVRGNETPGRRDQRVQAALERYFSDPVTLRYVDMPKTGAGRPALLLWARLLGKFKTAELTLAHLELTERGDRALAKLDVRLDAEGADGSFSDQRTAEVGLARRGDTWIVESVDVVAGTVDPAEARP
jgi:ketosteroid isomerase-like protein